MSSGIGADNATPSAINCYSAGVLKTISTASRIGVLLKNGSTLTNCYYLDGIQGTTKITPETGATAFYKTLEGVEINEGEDTPMTSADVVDELNAYIDAHKNDENTETNTSTWLKWRVGSNGLPELIFE
jgi:hypothetical protein